MMPEFVADLQSHGGSHFAKRVLSKVMEKDGSLRHDQNDHRYNGIDDAWIRYVSGGATAYRAIYIRKGEDVFLYRAGEHSVEDHLAAPKADLEDGAVQVGEVPEGFAAAAAPALNQAAAGGAVVNDQVGEFIRNVPKTEIKTAILSRRLLPHKDIWLVSPYVDTTLLSPTGVVGKLLLNQVEDGASVVLVTLPPPNQDIDWMETLASKGVTVFVYPRLHTKLYCFIINEEERYKGRWARQVDFGSMALVGSANLTCPGMAMGDGRINEELCYSVPPQGLEYLETYMLELMHRGFELSDVRSLKARGQWGKLEQQKW